MIFFAALFFTLLFLSGTSVNHRINDTVEELSNASEVIKELSVTEVAHIPATTGSSPSQETQTERVLVVVHRSHRVNQEITPTDTCGGVLVSPRIVITAAHCFYDAHGFYRRFPHMFGVTYRREGGIFWDVTRNGLRANLLVAHPGYKETGKLNDIGAMRLETACMSAIPRQSIPMVLWRKGDEDKMEMIVFFIENEHYANIRIDRIPVRWTRKFACCDAYHRWGVHISPKQICIESLDPDFSHRGESAILLANDQPIGVLSFHLDVSSSSNSLPYIYTDLTRYPGFIQREIRNDAIAAQKLQPYRICSSILYVVISLEIVK